MRETQNALTAIDQNKNDDAIAALERATGKLEIVLARTPTLALAPVDVSVVTHDVIGTPADVEKIRGEVGAAIAQGRLQLARKLLSDLGSETVVNISKLPLGTYPAALKQAAALLHQGKPQGAKAVLQTALGTIVIDQIVIPLPLVRAQLALEDTRSLLEKRKRTDAESARMRQLLGTARTQLQLGKALGYATDSEMTDLIASVDDLERKTAGSQSAKGLLDPFGPKFDEARRSSQRPR
ncbi:YfdX family protein [Sphingomonas melonis]